MMIKPLSLLSAALLLILLPACSGTGKVDVENPTIAQMDDLDVQWGLPRRVSRGTPRKYYPTTASESPVANFSPATLPASSPATDPGISPAAPDTVAPAPSSVDPSVINKLR